MLWRSTYHTQRGEIPAGFGISLVDSNGAPVPLSGASAIVLSPTPEDFRERELWLRLFRAELMVPWRIGFFATDPTKAQWSRFLEAHPPSVHRDCVCCTNMSLLDLGSGDRRTIALVLSGSEPQLMMVGPPNEEAWDEFLQAAIAAQTARPQP